MKLCTVVVQTFFSVLFVVLIFPSFVYITGNAKKQQFVFDRFFPTTVFQEVMEDLLLLQHDCSDCLDSECLKEDISLFIDVSIGRLFHIVYQLQTLVDKKVDLHAEDVTYLCTIVHRLLALYQDLFKHNMPVRAVHIKRLLATCKQLLKSYNT